MNKHLMMRVGSILIGLGLSLFLIVGGFKVAQTIFTQAGDVSPRDVVVKTTSSTAAISWTTGTATQGIVTYGTSATELNFNAPELEKTSEHLVQLTLLSPSTDYYYAIKINGKTYSNEKFTTKAAGEDSAGTSESVSDSSSSATLTPRPSPIQSLQIPNNPSSTTTGSTTSTCTATDCASIKAKIGSGCDTQDYFKCVRALTPTATP